MAFGRPCTGCFPLRTPARHQPTQLRISIPATSESLLPWRQEPEDEFEALLRQAWGTNVRVDIVMSLLGLAHCSETLVGDALVRGISGGERKRLTTAEMLVGPSNVIMLDEMSTGLVGWD